VSWAPRVNARRPVLLLVLAIALGSACSHRLVSADVGLWQLRGTVVAMTEDSVSVRHKSGRVFRIGLDDRTEYLAQRLKDSRQSVHVGSRVTIDVETRRLRGHRARRVQVFRR
jgi:hypothetical protein